NSDVVLRELNRIGRFTSEDIEEKNIGQFQDKVFFRIKKLRWDQVYSFCERLYSKLLKDVGYDYETYYQSIAEVQAYFTDEINLIMEEENLAFHFVDGQFHRRGRAQTQKAFERVGSVLVDPKLNEVRNHYNKAKKFFDARPTPDSENCVKEALCALEACIEILTLKNASKDFEKTIKQLQGNDLSQIPYPIGESMIKLHGYRGSGQGVAHASLQGNKVELVDAELVLSLVAAYITYLVDLFPPIENIPF
ncbi:MAG: hypothetical protein ABFD44_00195, partial [Anaerolineaceae bacterium]